MVTRWDRLNDLAKPSRNNMEAQKLKGMFGLREPTSDHPYYDDYVRVTTPKYRERADSQVERQNSVAQRYYDQHGVHIDNEAAQELADLYPKGKYPRPLTTEEDYAQHGLSRFWPVELQRDFVNEPGSLRAGDGEFHQPVPDAHGQRVAGWWNAGEEEEDPDLWPFAGLKPIEDAGNAMLVDHSNGPKCQECYLQHGMSGSRDPRHFDQTGHTPMEIPRYVAGVEDSWEHEAAAKKPKPKKPRKPEEVWYDVHKHPEGVAGGMGKSPEYHLRNRGWQPREIHGAGSKTVQYMNHDHPDFTISFGGASDTHPDHNFRILYMGTNRNIPKVTQAYSVAEAMNKVDELHEIHRGHIVLPMTHDSAYNYDIGENFGLNLTDRPNTISEQDHHDAVDLLHGLGPFRTTELGYTHLPSNTSLSRSSTGNGYVVHGHDGPFWKDISGAMPFHDALAEWIGRFSKLPGRRASAAPLTLTDPGKPKPPRQFLAPENVRPKKTPRAAPGYPVQTPKSDLPSDKPNGGSDDNSPNMSGNLPGIARDPNRPSQDSEFQRKPQVDVLLRRAQGSTWAQPEGRADPQFELVDE